MNAPSNAVRGNGSYLYRGGSDRLPVRRGKAIQLFGSQASPSEISSSSIGEKASVVSFAKENVTTSMNISYAGVNTSNNCNVLDSIYETNEKPA